MKIKSSRLGDFEIEENQIVSFADGIPGYENDKSFVIIPVTDESPFYYMQAVNNPELCLVVNIPFVFFPDFEVDLPDDVTEGLGIKNDESLAIYTVVTIPENFKESTANLLAPIIVNGANRQGIQYVPAKSKYSIKHRIFPEPTKK